MKKILKTDGNNPPSLSFSPHRLYNLRDMTEFFTYDFFTALSNLEWEGGDISLKVKQAGGASLASREDKQKLGNLMTELWKHCCKLELAASKLRISHLKSRIPAHLEVSFQVLESELSGLRHSILSELQQRKFVFVEPGKAGFFEQDALFGEKVNSAFPSAKQDIKEAGNCLAADLNTAAIFHLMRATEIGLRAAGRRLTPRSKSRIAYLEWGAIIKLMAKKVDAITHNGKPRSKKKINDLEFYNGIIGELDAFKDVWRNNVMHTRGHYSEHEAMGVFSHVRAFLQRLATRMSE